ncbi:MAG: hypothetical protein K8T10_14810 [Candidatus Eremiobacteraeota bacterium]|nr:hypothetical protein [Candidatus Eremiobacteraeota bacterium]
MSFWLRNAEEVFEDEFNIVGYDEGRPKKSLDNNNMRLVCYTDKMEKLVFWGTKGGDTSNIYLIFNSNLPVRVKCQYIDPLIEDFRIKYQHKYWCPEDASLKIIG